MIRIAAFTGGLSIPSARFRVRQYIPALRLEGVEVKEFDSGFGQYPPEVRWARPFWALATLAERLPDVVMSHRYDAVLLQREIMSSFVTLEPLTTRPRILDVDDAIFLQRGGGFAKRLAELSDKVICGNSYLAEWFGRWNINVDIIPTAVDTERYLPNAETKPSDSPLIIGWIGTSGNYKYLYGIEGALAKVMRVHPSTRLKVVGDQLPEFRHLPPDQVDFVSWSEAIEVQAIQSMDIGIMPLEDSPWTRGKCSYKMLQYMATGLPVVVSPIGMNAEVLTLGELGIGATTKKQWIDGLIALLENKTLRARLGSEGRRVVESSFSIHVVAPQLARSLLGK
ncbi:MAG TPA: glycosyltransferase family 4 protein [Sulfuriferula sp.]|nr:glycosyltransferase family 4 protein [Sulfuriferula sp.]